MIGMAMGQSNQGQAASPELIQDATGRPARGGIDEYVFDKINIDGISGPAFQEPNTVGNDLHE
jgi:hypothetical protein